MTKRKAVNWNVNDDDFTKMFWDQNIRQFWIDEEIPLSDDKITWMNLSKEEKNTYTEVVAALTLLDTEQGAVGMPMVGLAVDNLQHKAVLSFMGFMEHMHAKSYSSIFSTLCTAGQIEKTFQAIEENKILQSKLGIISNAYNNISDKKSLYLAMVCSVFLESFMFYSGFFYPLYLAGQGKLVNSGEIINLIIRDEAVHGVFVGLLAQNLYKEFTNTTQASLDIEVKNILEQLFIEENKHTKQLYGNLGLEKQVENFIKYNADKALMNIGKDTIFNINQDEMPSMIIKGLRTETKNHDFFSTKGNGYIKTTKVEKMNDSDFDF